MVKAFDKIARLRFEDSDSRQSAVANVMQLC